MPQVVKELKLEINWAALYKFDTLRVSNLSNFFSIILPHFSVFFQ